MEVSKGEEIPALGGGEQVGEDEPGGEGQEKQLPVEGALPQGEEEQPPHQRQGQGRRPRGDGGVVGVGHGARRVVGVRRQAEEGREHRGLSHRHRGEDQLLAAAGGQGDEDLRVAHGAGQGLGRGAVKLFPFQGEGQVQLGDLEQ